MRYWKEKGEGQPDARTDGFLQTAKSESPLLVIPVEGVLIPGTLDEMRERMRFRFYTLYGRELSQADAESLLVAVFDSDGALHAAIEEG